ncbi:MAG: hypothetical protein SPF07_00990 [Eubacteriales bacterium]|nr:hypothetical protein [Eubacteriales bacterium]
MNMKNTKLQEQIVELRILLQSVCDGFDTQQLNKKSTLTMRTKVLYVIHKYPSCPPSTLISSLGIAKSNLALLCKSLCDDGVIEATKGDRDQRNVYYTITPKGERELYEFYASMANDVKLTSREQVSMEKKFDDIIAFFNKKYK